MHLTNYSINKTNSEFKNPTDDEILLNNQASKRTLESLFNTLEQDERDIDVESLKEKIAYVCGKVMQLYCPMIEN